MTPAGDIVIVIASVLSVLALSSCVAAWAERRFPIIGMGVLLMSGGAFVYVHVTLSDGLTLSDIPNAFIHALAMALG